MNIKKTQNGTELVYELIGRLDTSSAPQLEAELKESIAGITKLVFDFSELDYISSGGLRILLSAQKVMNKQGEMTIRNANAEIMEIIGVTGFIGILNIE